MEACTRWAGVGAGRAIREGNDSTVGNLSEERVDSVVRGMGVVSFLLTAAKGRAEVDTVDSGNVSIGEVVVEERGAVAGYLDDGVMDNPVGPLFNAFGDFVGGEVPGAPDAVSKSAPDGVEHARLAGSGSNEVVNAGVEGVGVEGVVEAVAGNGRNVTDGEEMVDIVVAVVAEKAASSGVNSGGGRKGIVSKHDAGGAGIAGEPAREGVEVGDGLITTSVVDADPVKFIVEVVDVVFFDSVSVDHQVIEFRGGVGRDVDLANSINVGGSVIASSKVGAKSDGPGSGVGVRWLAGPQSSESSDVVGAHVFRWCIEAVDVTGSDGMQSFEPVAVVEPRTHAGVDEFDVVVRNVEVVTDEGEDGEKPDIPDGNAAIEGIFLFVFEKEIGSVFEFFVGACEIVI